MDASDYLAQVKALIVANPKVAHWSLVREEEQGDRGYPHHVHDGRTPTPIITTIVL
jgi:hypothetical protein